MNFAMILSSAALGLSFAVTVFKIVHWLLHADPRRLASAARWSLFAVAMTSGPALIALLLYRQWTPAMLLGAAILVAPAAINWRAFIPRRPFRRMRREGRPLDDMRGDFGQPPPDAELARRAAIILEDYLSHAGYPEISARIDGGRPAARQHRSRQHGSRQQGPCRDDARMDAEEALEVLGLEAGAAAAAVRAAHRRLAALVHPDRGGSNYLAAKISRAKDVLLAEAALTSRAVDEDNVKEE